MHLLSRSFFSSPQICRLSFLARPQTPPPGAGNQHHGPASFAGIPLPHPRIHPPSGEPSSPGVPAVFDATSMGEPLILDHNWHLGIATGIEPSKTDFNDSNWPLRDPKQALAEVYDSAADSHDHPHDAGRNGSPGRPRHGTPSGRALVDR